MWAARSTAALGLLLVTSDVSAQRADTNALVNATTLRCDFRVVATGGWRAGAAEANVKPADLMAVFSSINSDEGTAVSIGRFGRSEIIAKLSVGTLHFMQSFKDGPLYVTTVFSAESRPGRFKAVHTRHEYADVHLPGFTSSPEQYYGECAME